MLSVILIDVELRQTSSSAIGRWICWRFVGKFLAAGLKLSLRFPQPVTRPLNPVVIILSKKQQTTTLEVFGLFQVRRGHKLVLHPGDLLVGQTDRVDHITELNLSSKVQQSDIPVQVLPPVVLWVDDYSVHHHNLLDTLFKPGYIYKRLLLASLVTWCSSKVIEKPTWPCCVCRGGPVCRLSWSSCSRVGRGCSELQWGPTHYWSDLLHIAAPVGSVCTASPACGPHLYFILAS